MQIMNIALSLFKLSLSLAKLIVFCNFRRVFPKCLLFQGLVTSGLFRCIKHDQSGMHI